MTPEQVEQIIAQFAQTCVNENSGITALGRGENAAGQSCIKVTVLGEDNKANIPDEYKGVPVVVTVVNEPTEPAVVQE